MFTVQFDMDTRNYVLDFEIYNNKIEGNCVLASYLMIKNLFEGDIDFEKEEKELTSKLKYKVNTVDLLSLLKNDNYQIKVYSENNFHNKIFKDKKTRNFVSNYVNCIKEFNLYEETEIKLTENLLKKLLRNGYILLANGIQDEKPHMRVIYGLEGRKFFIADPSKKNNKVISFSRLNIILRAPLGFWFVAVKPK